MFFYDSGGSKTRAGIKTVHVAQHLADMRTRGIAFGLFLFRAFCKPALSQGRRL